MQLLYWHWLVFGMVLAMAELFIPSFTILWFGLGAVIVSALLWLVPDLDMSWQLLVWVVASTVFTALWFRYFKPLMVDRTKAGISREAVVGEIGLVVQVPADGRRGRVRFTTPLLGADEWPFISQGAVASGDRVQVTDVSGNTLLVAKTTPAADAASVEGE